MQKRDLGMFWLPGLLADFLVAVNYLSDITNYYGVKSYSFCFIFCTKYINILSVFLRVVNLFGCFLELMEACQCTKSYHEEPKKVRGPPRGNLEESELALIVKNVGQKKACLELSIKT